MGISMGEESNYSPMVIDMKVTMQMGSHKGMEFTIGIMEQFTKVNSRMESGMAMDSGSLETKSMKVIM